MSTSPPACVHENAFCCVASAAAGAPPTTWPLGVHGGGVGEGAGRADQRVRRAGAQEGLNRVGVGADLAGDLTGGVDCRCPAVAGHADVDHRAVGRRPGECMLERVAGERAVADDRAVGVDRRGEAVGAAERAQVHRGRAAGGPHGRALLTVRQRAHAGDRAGVVDRHRVAVGAAERVQVGGHVGRGPADRVLLGVVGGGAVAGDLAARVHRDGGAERRRRGQRSQIDHAAGRSPGEGVVQAGRGEAVADDLARVVDGGRVTGGAAERAQVGRTPARGRSGGCIRCDAHQCGEHCDKA